MEAVVQWEDVVHVLFDVTSRFPKAQRFVLTNRIMNMAILIAEKLVAAQYLSKEGQPPLLQEINGLFTQLRLLLRIASRESWLSKGRLKSLVESIDSIGRMVYGWKTSTKRISPDC